MIYSGRRFMGSLNTVINQFTLSDQFLEDHLPILQPATVILSFDYCNQIHLIPLSGAYCTKHYANYLYETRVRMLVPTNVAGNTTWAAPSRSGRWKRSLDFRTGESTRPCIVHAMKGWLLTNIEMHTEGKGYLMFFLIFCKKKCNKTTK